VPAAAHQPSSSSTRSSQTAKINPKLEYYLALIASSKGVALQKLIRDLLASSGIYVFGEILQAKPIQEVGPSRVFSPVLEKKERTRGTHSLVQHFFF
jgi:hypothetical protein